MRPEHKPTADENDMTAGYWDVKKGRWQYYYLSVAKRPKIRKRTKTISHRIDRARAKQEIRKEMQ